MNGENVSMIDLTKRNKEMNYPHVPSQEIILVCVFVINLHLQLLTRHFMDNNLTYNTHIMAWGRTEGFAWELFVWHMNEQWTVSTQRESISSKWNEVL